MLSWFLSILTVKKSLPTFMVFQDLNRATFRLQALADCLDFFGRSHYYLKVANIGVQCEMVMVLNSQKNNKKNVTCSTLLY